MCWCVTNIYFVAGVGGVYLTPARLRNGRYASLFYVVLQAPGKSIFFGGLVAGENEPARPQAPKKKNRRLLGSIRFHAGIRAEL